MTTDSGVVLRENWTGTVHLLKPITLAADVRYKRACRIIARGSFGMEDSGVRRGRLSDTTCRNCKRTVYYKAQQVAMTDRLDAVEYTLIPTPGKAWLAHVQHGESVTGRNLTAIVGGNRSLCKPQTCKWCDDLRKRCQSRRIA